MRRGHLPFTPTEFARARALVELDARLGVRMPARKDVLTLPEGHEITIRRAGTEDLAAAQARCTSGAPRARSRCATTARSRDADRYLSHLLSPRFGRSLAVRPPRAGWSPSATCCGTATRTRSRCSSRTSGSGAGSAWSCCASWWDGGRGGLESVYAVTQASNTGMVAAMRGPRTPARLPDRGRHAGDHRPPGGRPAPSRRRARRERPRAVRRARRTRLRPPRNGGNGRTEGGGNGRTETAETQKRRKRQNGPTSPVRSAVPPVSARSPAAGPAPPLAHGRPQRPRPGRPTGPRRPPGPPTSAAAGR